MASDDGRGTDAASVTVAVPTQPEGGSGGVVDAGALAAPVPRRGTRLVWWQRKSARAVLRTVFSILNVLVFFTSLLILVEFVREIEREQENAGVGDTPLPPGATGPAPTSDQDLPWRERYVMLGRDVFGDDYKAVIDVYFGFIIVATFAGAFGALLRQSSPIFVAVGCYVPAWFMTLVATIGIHRHLAEHPVTSEHDESKARYSVALAWSWLCLIVVGLLFVVGIYLGRSMRTHKADRYRITRRGRLQRGDEDDEEEDENADLDYAETMVSNVPHFTTDGSGPPRARQEAKLEQHRRDQEYEKHRAAASSSPQQPTTAAGAAASTDSATTVPAAAAAADLTGSFANRAIGARKDAAVLTADDVRRILLQATVDELPTGVATEKQQCHHVYDGDTLTLHNRERVRLVGIDTPEISRFEPFAEEARAFTNRWCQQRTLFLQQPVPANATSSDAVAVAAAVDEKRTNASAGNDKFMVDKYGRRRAVVFVAIRKDQLEAPIATGGNSRTAPAAAAATPASATPTKTAFLNVNEALLLLGFATFYHPCPEHECAFQARFIALQREAREAGRGVWGGFTDREVCFDKRADVFHNYYPKGAPIPAAGAGGGKPCDAGRGLGGKAGQDARYVKMLASEALDAGYGVCRECQGAVTRQDLRGRY